MIDLNRDRFAIAMRAEAPASAQADDGGVHTLLEFIGTAGDDNFRGGDNGDNFHLEAGGHDTARGGGGKDTFYMGAALDAGDHLDGGSDQSGQGDHVVLDGDYSGGLVLKARTLQNMEAMILTAGHDYDVTLNADPASGHAFIVDGSTLGTGDHMRIDASGVDGSSVSIRGGYGADVLIGGHATGAIISNGGADTITGGGAITAFGDVASISTEDGNDTINIDSQWDGHSTINGGMGDDTLFFTGLSVGETVLSDHLSGIEHFIVRGGRVVVADGLADHANVLSFNATASSSSFYFDGSQEDQAGFTLQGSQVDDTLIGGGGSDLITGNKGANTMFGGAGDDQITGGAAHDKLVGQDGADLLTGGDGPDSFVFQAVSESTAAATDEIKDLLNVDTIDLKAIDADTKKAGNQAFHLVDAFTHHRGELTVSYDHDTGRTMVSGDVNGDGAADLVISIDGNHADFANFIL